ncbi:hypothetical protein NUU61_001215 [Penicillium alfredii]|uniref:Uncharacterized protein n=1 Tax=Penicillium alfredii TaxID=1506179 RepID=A0A9W9KRR7_9EURO|nr:uncharacterized protein NUU61_001215 [Penicillium alfredii]KAJ5115456.1 hypothetical protein NUU61_001215 [Penicillium alfredii]
MSSPAVQTSPQELDGTPRPSEVPSTPNFDVVRCSRCQQSLSRADHTTPGAVQCGMNSYYCTRCATKVGFVR